MLSFKLKFDICIVGHRSWTTLIFVGVGVIFFFTGYKKKKSYIAVCRLKIFECVLVLLNYLNVCKINVYIFRYVWLTLEIICIAFMVLSYINFLYIIRFLCIEAILKLFRCIKAIKCLKSQVRIYHLFFKFTSVSASSF